MSYLTVFRNGSITPTEHSVQLDDEPDLGEPITEVGSLKIWAVGGLRIILSLNKLTTSP